MSTKTILTVRGRPVFLEADGRIRFRAGYTVCADGSPFAYGPPGTKPLDYLANAGRPGNWWGIVTDANGEPVVQGKGDPAPGYYVSQTAYFWRYHSWDSPHRYLWAECIPYVVIPAPLRMRVKPVVLGCAAVVRDTRTGREAAAVVGEIGPATHLGEISIKLARLLGLPSDAKRDGTEEPVLEYELRPGVPAVIDKMTYPLLPA